MPVITYEPSEPQITELLPEGDYRFEVIQAREDVQRNGKTKDSTTLKMRLMVYHDPWRTRASMVFEDLIFHPSTHWKICNFAECTDMKVAKGQPLDVNQHNVVGLRGWCRLIHNRYLKKNPQNPLDKPVEVVNNKVGFYYTDREKFAPKSQSPAEVPVTAAADDDVPF